MENRESKTYSQRSKYPLGYSKRILQERETGDIHKLVEPIRPI